MIKITSKHWFAVLALLTTACTSDSTNEARRDTTSQNVDAPPVALDASASYDFQQPDVSFALPEVLKEISGLTLLADGNLGAVQDEAGTVFVINPKSGAIEARHSFADAGDYEGIEQVGNSVYVLRSDGTLTELSLGAATEPRTIETALKPKNDTEGLAYDAAGNRLLIACKEAPGDGQDKDDKAVYAYDLERGELTAEPVIVIDTKELEDQFDVGGKFKPAGLTARPDGSLLVLSATSKAIAVVGADGQVKEYWQLPAEIFEQPEAIALGANGTLYVASEGADGPGMLYAFSPRAAGQ